MRLWDNSSYMTKTKKQGYAPFAFGFGPEKRDVTTTFVTSLFDWLIQYLDIAFCLQEFFLNLLVIKVNK